MSSVNPPTPILPKELVNRGDILESGVTDRGQCYVLIKEAHRYRRWHIAATVIGTIVTGIVPMLVALLFPSVRNRVSSWCMWEKKYEVSQTTMQSNKTILQLFEKRVPGFPSPPSPQPPPQLTTLGPLATPIQDVAKPPPSDSEETTASQEFQKWKELAEGGDAEAQEHLGNCYYSGTGVEESKEEAVKWYELAANQGNAAAQKNLGVCYRNGYGVEKNHIKGFRWYKLAAGQGHAEAQNNLGECYFNGEGVEADEKEACKWFQLAAKQGHARAYYNLGLCYKDGRGVDKDSATAQNMFREADELGEEDAEEMLEGGSS